MTAPPSKPVAPAPIMMWVIHFAFIMSISIYLMLSWFLQRQGSLPEAPPQMAGLLLAVVGGLSLAQVFFSLNITKVIKSLDAPIDTDARNYLAINRRLMIVTDALFESIAVYGLVGLLLGMKLSHAMGFMSVAALLLLVNTQHVNGWISEYNRRLAVEAEIAKRKT